MSDSDSPFVVITTMGSVCVLDLDETLVFAIANEEFFGANPAILNPKSGTGKQARQKELSYRAHESWKLACSRTRAYAEAHLLLKSFQNSSHFVYVRPHAVELIRYCRENFRCLIIFTAANQAHATSIHENLFVKLAGVRADYIFHRDHCGRFPQAPPNIRASLAPADVASIGEFQKNLAYIRQLVEQMETTCPSAEKDSSPTLDWTDCLFIDDSAMHAVTNGAYTLISPRYDYPSLRALLVTPGAGSRQPQLLREAAADVTLARIRETIAEKMQMQHEANAHGTSYTWSMVDKKFSLFQQSVSGTRD